MTKKSKQRRGGPFSRIMTIIGTLLVGIITLIAAIMSGIGEPAEDVVPSPQPIIVTRVAVAPGNLGNVTTMQFNQGYGAQRDFWQVYFTAPTGSRDSATYVGGVDQAIVDAINGVRSTLDIAAFEWNNPRLTQAVIDAHNRGVRVRMVVDDEHALEDDGSTIRQVIDAGVPVVDDGRSGLMHNKFMIMDSTVVFTGSMNYTINGAFRNNNNVLALRARRAVEAYQAEFEEMFTRREFGSSRSAQNSANFMQDGVPVVVVFSPEDDVLGALSSALQGAENNIRFMAFSFTLSEIGDILLQKAAEGVDVSGIFEVRGSRTEFSELPRLLCAGLEIREDGNPFTFHHKVFIIDDQIVATGSFNFSANATRSNDENMVIIQDADLAAQYLAEYDRMMSQAAVPPASAITCP